MSPFKLQKVKEYLEEMLSKGFISLQQGQLCLTNPICSKGQWRSKILCGLPQVEHFDQEEPLPNSLNS